MSKEILNLQPQNVWKHFYELTQIPRPTAHMEQVTQFVVDFGNSLGLETKKDKAGNVLIIKPASAGMENAPTVILQSHLDMVFEANSDAKLDSKKDTIKAYIDGDKVKAQGTTLGADNGIGVAAMMAILEDKSLKHGTIEALFTIDEEVGMTGAFGLEAGFLKGSILLNLDTEDEGELCIGCAGGADVNVNFQYKDVEVPEGDVAYKISLTGLKGGHSGGEIHLGRANANKLVFYFLKEVVAEYEVRLASINGGGLRNAIPREAFATVTLPEENAELFLDTLDEYSDIYKEEYKSTEDNIIFKAEKAELPKTLIPEEIQDSLINAVVACQNGVISMLSDFPGVVETSTNLASVKSKEGIVEIKILARSSSETRKAELCSSLESAFALAGAKVEIDAEYPGWQPNIHSKTKDLMISLAKESIGMEAEVKVVHAGLECGIILDSTPGLDIVSFGPTILNPHSPDEYVVIDTVGRFYNYLLKVLENLK